MTRALCLTLLLIGTAWAQSEDAGLPGAPATTAAASGERVLEGRLDYVTDPHPFRLGRYWWVTDNGTRYPSSNHLTSV